MKTLQFWFEFGSTYSYPASMRIEQLAAERGIRIGWKAFLLGPIFNAQGWNDSPFNLYPAKGSYMWRDLERVCLSTEIPFRRPSRFPRNGILAARIACLHANAPWVAAFVKAVYTANFAHDLDIADTAVIGQCLTSAGQEPAAVIAQAQSPESKSRLRAQCDEAAALGIFGAPFFVAGGELFWGNDRLEQAIACCTDGGIQPRR